MLLRALAALTLFTVSGLSFAAPGSNGKFSVPTLRSFEELSEAERAKYREGALEKLADPHFVHKPNHYSSPSYFVTDAGKAELKAITAELVKAASQHGRIISIGRSGNGIMAYLSAILSKLPGMSGTIVEDLPFSCNEPRMLKKEHKEALRKYLRANKLSPRKIAAAKKPILFFDFLYTATGAGTLISFIGEWAKEEGLSAEVKAKLRFFGGYAPRMIVENHLMRLRHDLIRDGNFKEFTQDYIEGEIRSQELPGRWTMKDNCARVYAFRLTDAMYIYAGTHGYNAQKSFTPENWQSPIDRAEVLGFAGKSSEPAYLELAYLMEAGLREHAEYVPHIGCESALKVR